MWVLQCVTLWTPVIPCLVLRVPGFPSPCTLPPQHPALPAGKWKSRPHTHFLIPITSQTPNTNLPPPPPLQQALLTKEPPKSMNVGIAMLQMLRLSAEESGYRAVALLGAMGEASVTDLQAAPRTTQAGTFGAFTIDGGAAAVSRWVVSSRPE